MAITVTKKADGTFQFKGRSFQPTKDKNKALEPYGKQLHEYGKVLLLLPAPEQAKVLNQQIGNARFVRNHYLADRIAHYEKNKTTLSVNDYKSDILPVLKKENPFLAISDKFALESAIENVDKAYNNFFDGLKEGRKVGFPKFASKWKQNGSSYTTKQTNGNIKVVLGKDGLPYIQLPKVGLIRIIIPKGETIADICPPGVSILRATIKHTGSRYEVSLQLEGVMDIPSISGTYSLRDVLSMDLGLKIFGAVSDGEETEHIENPRWIKRHERRLRRLQKALSRKQYDQATHTGSKNRKKARLRVAKEQRKIANQRKDFHHKLSRIIADSCSVFVCETLNIKGMVKNHKLAKEISSVGWGRFLQMVKYKMKHQGKRFIQVERTFASSQTCSCCGYKNPEVKDLKVRKWDCPSCGAHHDRDDNAGVNLYWEGIRILEREGVIFVA